MRKPLSNRNLTTIYLFFFFMLVCVSFICTSSAKDLTPISNSTKAKIQLAILLDTSSSMDGLIDQARSQLWQVVNEFSSANRDGQKSILEVAVFEYGNDRLPSQDGYIRKVIGLSSDLDRVSEALFSLKTNGGQEYCGYAISTATSNLQWSASDSDIKAIFIAGNEPFTQGPISYRSAITAATTKGITVNTIHAGNHNKGVQTGWKEGAVLASGNYMSIDHNQKIAHIVAPQDQSIANLNRQLNSTYIPYGENGNTSLQRQQEQDDNNSGISLSLLASRAKAKISDIYDSAKWDLVDALKSGEIDLNTIDQSSLPEPMQAMDLEEQTAYINEQTVLRSSIQNEIKSLSKERETFIAKKQEELIGHSAPTISDALSQSVREQGLQKNFEFKTQ